MKVIGLMSGTSCDGVDAALIDISGSLPRLTIKPIAFISYPYHPSIREQVLTASSRGTVATVCHLNVVLGEVFAKAAQRVIKKSGLSASAIHAIGSHGQTIHHLPTPVRVPSLGSLRSTLQIAEPAVIAERTGITTVGNFRARDMAVGGEGAPLAPFAHYCVFQHRSYSRLILNLGGIGNVTYLPAKGALQSVQAFDTGPANMLLDGLIKHYSKGVYSFDRGGKWAGKGMVNHTLFRTLMAHPYLKKIPPKTTGREDFGEKFLNKIIRMAQQRKLSKYDALATCAKFTGVTVAESLQWLSGPVDQVVVGGGGVWNRTIMRNLRQELTPIPIQTFEDMNWSSNAFESVAFALLAYQTVRGRPSNIPSVTGASRSVVLGTIVPGARPIHIRSISKR